VRRHDGGEPGEQNAVVLNADGVRPEVERRRPIPRHPPDDSRS